jgi:hypothetical protein
VSDRETRIREAEEKLHLAYHAAAEANKQWQRVIVAAQHELAQAYHDGED